MAERAKDSGPEWNGLRTGPVTSLTEALKSLPGDQFHLLSRTNSDQPSDLNSSRDSGLASGEPETLMALFGENDGFEDAKERWEADRYPKKWSLATKMTMVALIAIAFAIAIPLVFYENNWRLLDAIAPRIVPKQTANETAPAVARKSGETPLLTAEQNRPRDPANGLNPGLTPDSAADAKPVAQDQNVPPPAPAATQGPARTVDKQELVNALAPVDTKSMDQGQDVSPQAPAAPQSPAETVDKEELASGPSPDQTAAADAKSKVQGQSAAPQAMAGAQSPTRTIEKEELATAPSPDQTAAEAKSMVQGLNVPPQAPATTQKPTGTIDQEKLAAGPTQDQAATDTNPVGQVRNATPVAPAATPSSERTIDKEQLASLVKRGRYLLSVGDIASARLLLERAADAHDASAAFDLAGTYDPAVLTRSHVFGIPPDVAMARMWYEKALGLGYSEARERLTQLQK